ncbi:endonuclease/exonuclease/phosphatase family protein [Streptomyces albus]
MTRQDSTASGDLMVVTHNVNADNPHPERTARQLARSGADVIALEEVPSSQSDFYEDGLRKSHPYHKLAGTVGIWSKYPLSGARTVDIKMGWPRAIRATVRTPKGVIAVYTAHLPSVRVQFKSGFTAGQRDASARALGRAISHDRADTVILLGDLNGTMNDRALAPITSQMRSPRVPRARASASAGRSRGRWRGSTRSWSRAPIPSRPGHCRPPGATTSPSRPR